MNAKLKKSLNIAAAAFFVIGLAINVQMSLDDPFSTVNAVALAQQTGTGDSGGDQDGGTNSNGGTTCDGWWDCAEFVASMQHEKIYNHTGEANFTVSIIIGDVPIPISISLGSGQVQSGFVGIYKYCDTSISFSCDKGEQGWVPNPA